MIRVVIALVAILVLAVGFSLGFYLVLLGTVVAVLAVDLLRAPAARLRARTKVCPDCSEHVKASAKVCRYCGRRFEPAA